jgi:pyruvate/2-oxoglutarate dehydrogenase complex dihydrolipoamide dehydrogenase (E3) component
MGVAGESVAGPLAEAGLSVVGIDHRLVGGECAYWGCVPTKIMVRQANLLAEARRAGAHTGPAELRDAWARVVARVRDVTHGWDDTPAVERFEGKGGRFVRGRGCLVAADAVRVDGAVFRAERAVVIATGTSPSTPDVEGIDDVHAWTNREAVMAEALPESIVILGGGAVGVELAEVWARFGVRVALIEHADRVLEPEEPEASALVEQVLADEGVEVHTGTRATRVARDGHGIEVTTEGGGRACAQRLLVATGRSANLGGLDLRCAGLDDSGEVVAVDDHLRAAPGIWAVGDVTGQGEFTHVATRHAEIAVAAILGRPIRALPAHAIPRVTFTDPEVAAVGLTEAAAIDAGYEVETAGQDLAESARGWIHGDGGIGLIKLVTDATTGVVLGATSVGPSGGEVLSLLTLAVHARLTADVLRDMVYAYPTFHRAVLDATRALEPT